MRSGTQGHAAGAFVGPTVTGGRPCSRRAALLRAGRVMAGAATLQLGACAVEPAGRAELLDFLRDGSTTRAQVELGLGEPSARFEDSHVLAYRLRKDRNGYVLLRRRDDWATVQYDLMLLFDDAGVLQRHALVEVHAS